MDYKKLSKEELLEQVGIKLTDGADWGIEGRGPDSLNKGELVKWLEATEKKVEAPVNTVQAEPEKPKKHDAPAMTGGAMEDHTPEGVKNAARRQFYRGIRIHTVKDQLIGHRIYKDIVLENGLGYKLSLDEWSRDVTYEKHA